MEKAKITAVVLTKNESSNIKKCLNALYFCSEILVVDDDSTDDTAEIARKLGARVIVRSLNKDYAAQNNFALAEAKNLWVLFIDADEIVSETLANEIRGAVKNTTFQCYRLKRSDFIWGKRLEHGEAGSFSAIRLIKKGSGKWKRRVHQYFEPDGDVGWFNTPIDHYPHQNLREFVISVDRWSSWHALANSEEGKKSDIFKVVFYPLAHFANNYFFKLGFLDGMPGFVFASVMAFHSFLSWSKLYLMQRDNNV